MTSSTIPASSDLTTPQTETEATTKAPTAAQEHQSNKKAKFRDPWPDNARFIAAVLIVAWHMAADIYDRSGAVQLFYFSTWPMRVPLYALLAGYFSSAAPIGPKRAVQLLRNILFVYLIFDLLQQVQRWSLGYEFNFNPGSPTFALWFLLSLFFWRISLPVLSRIRWIIPVAILVALIAGYATKIGAPISASRTLGYLPIFLVGWKLREIGLHKVLDRVWVRFAAVGFYILWFIYVYLNHSDMKRRWFSMTGPYSLENPHYEMLMRVITLAAGILGALAILALIPRSHLRWITYLGAGSLYIYLLHPFVIRWIGRTDYFDSMDSRLDVIGLFVLALALGVFLGSKPIRFLFRPLIQPRYTWLFLAEDADTRPKKK